MRLFIRAIARTTDPALAPFMAQWAVVLWALNNVTDNRFWHLLPYRLRYRWGSEWTDAYMRWKAAGYPQRTVLSLTNDPAVRVP